MPSLCGIYTRMLEHYLVHVHAWYYLVTATPYLLGAAQTVKCTDRLASCNNAVGMQSA